MCASIRGSYIEITVSFFLLSPVLLISPYVGGGGGGEGKGEGKGEGGGR